MKSTLLEELCDTFLNWLRKVYQLRKVFIAWNRQSQHPPEWMDKCTFAHIAQQEV
jgi:hypothetical protein